MPVRAVRRSSGSRSGTSSVERPGSLGSRNSINREAVRSLNARHCLRETRSTDTGGGADRGRGDTKARSPMAVLARRPSCLCWRQRAASCSTFAAIVLDGRSVLLDRVCFGCIHVANNAVGGCRRVRDRVIRCCTRARLRVGSDRGTILANGIFFGCVHRVGSGAPLHRISSRGEHLERIVGIRRHGILGRFALHGGPMCLARCIDRLRIEARRVGVPPDTCVAAMGGVGGTGRSAPTLHTGGLAIDALARRFAVGIAAHLLPLGVSMPPGSPLSHRAQEHISTGPITDDSPACIGTKAEPVASQVHTTPFLKGAERLSIASAILLPGYRNLEERFARTWLVPEDCAVSAGNPRRKRATPRRFWRRGVNSL